MDKNIILCGLGNYGNEYKLNRHNAGFIILDFLYEELLKNNINITNFAEEKKFYSEISKFSIFFNGINYKFFLIKPLTYMNLSGKAIAAIKNFYKIDLNNILVIHDEVDFIKNKVRFKFSGGNGGHNGLKSIDSTISNKYLRLRIGVGRPSDKNIEFNDSLAKYVLADFEKDDINFLKNISKILYKNLCNIFSDDEKIRNNTFQSFY